MEEEENFAPKLSGGVKSLCKPIDHPDVPEDGVCFKCGKKATDWVLWGRSY